ncbi:MULTISPECIES: neutral zinc metallopeptidase [Prauserella salsuginis group]|uniref:Neutral zinc metallopeptidase n=2 Tax=Prauserella salsuginis group TaxID=2893672 RepID=A0ABW6G555_9PSEU|nr:MULTISPECIES: neutral zinc metallopeptidase [Prauserella salsuginis group]MBB3665885.1 putative metalloprotease [Prauserella sediminis]MCR3718869.1 putative metalloprotease [Prauserella flava]MCR3733439.1 putative metalloprotease [Prauserella salsuginis]
MRTGGRPGRIAAARIIAGMAVVALTATGCAGEQVTGELQTVGDVAGLPVTHFESGLKDNAAKPDVQAEGATDAMEDRLALASIADVTDYWDEQMPEHFGEKFEHVDKLMSYDPEGDSQEVCGTNTRDMALNAFYCPPEDLVAWDRGVLLPLLREKFGDMAVAAVLAHEFGHAVQTRLGDKAGIDEGTSTIVKEQQADCFTGSYMRWIAEGDSKYFELSTSDGVNEVLGALFLIRDAPGAHANEQGAHGSGFDRTYAVQLGFEEGAKRCAEIDKAEVDQRITEVPFKNATDQAQQGQAPITAGTMVHVQRSLDQAFSGSGVDAPEIVEGDGTCDQGRSTPPVSYCQQGNEVNIDLATLEKIGQPADQVGELTGEKSPDAGLGDFAVFSEVASRYVQGIQHGVGAPTEGGQAGLRTACLVGAWAQYANDPNSGSTLYLSPGDLDEAIAELLQPRSLLAADISGHRVANGFARIEALRNGFLDGSSVCTETYK